MNSVFGSPGFLGSSPLARGLPGHGPGARPLPGIIPARAGFTVIRRAGISTTSDHPRSRGVYAWTACGVGRGGGSSPLARGLPDPPVLAAEMCRIIPARAGFTRPRPVGHGRGQDHPRSRGVYDVTDNQFFRPQGSSPLARGLRLPEITGVGAGRIIPARAGFTVGRACATAVSADHPRSRGVYPSRITSGFGAVGSSPLARGLLVMDPSGCAGRGIIPARAGFTRTRAVSARPDRGSSPLARGLRMGSGSSPLRGGIIPARAGFTQGGAHGVRTQADHPRSRGVYSRERIFLTPDQGSSPLARGLRSSPSSQRTEIRIIPARAGFTG